MTTVLPRHRRRSPVEITPDIVASVERLSRYSIGQAEIAGRVGVSASSVQRIVHAARQREKKAS